MKKLSLILLFFAINIVCTAQQTVCTQTLRQARTVYDDGRIQELPSLLSSCLNNGFTDEEKTEAYRLLILAYIYLDEPVKADETMLALLRANSEFQINESADPAELINLYSTFRTKPIFLFGGQFNVNYTNVNVISTYGLHDINHTAGEYTPEISVGGSLIIEKIIYKRFTARAEVNYVTNKFKYSLNYLADNSDPRSIATIDAVETQSWLGLTLMGQFSILKNSDWNPYLSLGGSFNYLSSDELDAGTIIIGGEQATGTSVDLKNNEMRTNYNLTVNAELGVKKKVGKIYFIAHARYNYGLDNITETHYNNELSLKYGMGLNDISTHYATLSLGLLIPQFSPKKLTK